MVETPDKISVLNSFLMGLYAQEKPLNEILLASVHFELARVFASQKQLAKTNRHIVFALTWYTDANHTVGHLACRHLQVRLTNNSAYPPWSPYRTTNARVLILIAQQFEKEDDMTSHFEVLVNIQEFAHQTWNSQLHLIAARSIEELAFKSGSWLLEVGFQLGQAAVFLTQTGHSAKVLECVDAILPKVRIIRVPYLTGQVACIAGLAYENMGDGLRALECAEESYNAWKNCGERDASAGATQVLRCRRLVIERSSDDGPHQMADLMLSAREWITKDLAARFWQEAVDKLFILATFEFEQCRGASKRNTAQSRAIIDHIATLARSLPERERGLVMANTMQQRSNLFFLDPLIGDFDDTISGYKDALKIYVDSSMLYHGATVRQQLGLCYYHRYQKVANLQDLINAQNEFEIAYDAYENMAQTTQCISASYFSALCWFVAWDRHGRGNTMIMENSLDAMSRVEKWMDYRRQELSAMSTMEALQQKQALALDDKCRKTYSMAQELCLAEHMPQDCWAWVQKAKARSVADLLGLGIIIPESVQQAARKSPAAWMLVEQRDTLLLEIQKASPDRRILLRSQIDSLQKQMKEFPELNQISALQLGWPLNLERLQALFSDQWTLAKVNVVMVDWVSLGNRRLVMLVVDRRLKPEVYYLDIDVAQVESWISDNFADPEKREQCLDEDVDDPDAMFRQLDPLIAPLRNCTKRNDLLVFSATAPLHSLPLHALKLCEDGRQITLIERNPVVYCPGLTIYEQCVVKALHTLTQPPSANVNHSRGVRIAAVYDVADENAYLLPERNAIYTHMRRLASQLSPAASLLLGAEVTKSRFREFVDDAGLIHFHGHCNFDAANVLRHRLILARKKDDTVPAAIPTPAPALSSSLTLHPIERKKDQLFLLHASDNNNYLDTNDEDSAEAESLAVREIFSLSLASSPHVTLIACDSALQNVGPGDEPLGIATAFLCAGAASFMGTLWSMPSREGRAFSDRFYASFHEQSGKEYVDLAQALQSAVVSIMRDTRNRSFRYWAPLVLHGAWFCKRFEEN